MAKNIPSLPETALDFRTQFWSKNLLEFVSNVVLSDEGFEFRTASSHVQLFKSSANLALVLNIRMVLQLPH